MDKLKKILHSKWFTIIWTTVAIPLLILKLYIMLFGLTDLYNSLQPWESLLCLALIATATLKKIL